MAALKQRALDRAQPLGAHLELTYRCTWRCVFCYNPRHHDPRGLTGAEWVAVLDELRALGTLSVTLTGGDPLTRPDFFEIAAAARGFWFGSSQTARW
jgi:MoaA/NifB/PqqE/SkfB family radical SAM enzyme